MECGGGRTTANVSTSYCLAYAIMRSFGPELSRRTEMSGPPLQTSCTVHPPIVVIGFVNIYNSRIVKEEVRLRKKKTLPTFSPSPFNRGLVIRGGRPTFECVGEIGSRW